MKPSLRVVGWLVGGIALVFIVTVLTVMAMVRHSQTELRRYRAELEKRGERFETAAFEPSPAPKENNGGPAVIVAVQALLSDSGTRENAVAEAARLQPQIDTLRAATDAPHLALDLKYGTDLFEFIPETGMMEGAAIFLSADAHLKLEKQDAAGALEDIEAVLKIARMASRQPAEKAQAVCLRILDQAQNMTWEFLQKEVLTSADLTWLQAAWEKFQPVTSLASCLRFERAVALTLLAEAGTVIEGDLKAIKSWDDLREATVMVPWLLIYRHADEKEFIKTYQQVLDRIPSNRPVPYGALFQMMDLHKLAPTRETTRPATSFFSEEIASVLKAYARTEVLKNLTITAIALRRYQLDHGGDVPTSLDPLVPKYLNAVPRDPFADGALRYQPDGNTFILYSVGLDGKDGSGQTHATEPGAAALSLERTDIVWPRAALEEKGAEQKKPDPAP